MKQLACWEAIRELRKSMGMSQQAFATAAHISMSGLQKYENGRAPQVRQLVSLARLAKQNSQPELFRFLLGEINRKSGLNISDVD